MNVTPNKSKTAETIATIASNVDQIMADDTG